MSVDRTFEALPKRSFPDPRPATPCQSTRTSFRSPHAIRATGLMRHLRRRLLGGSCLLGQFRKAIGPDIDGGHDERIRHAIKLIGGHKKMECADPDTLDGQAATAAMLGNISQTPSRETRASADARS